MITALCGGVGGSKLVLGLYRTLPAHELNVVVNTADDLQYFGLHVSPDLDTVTYTLAGMSPIGRGWGIEGDTFKALETLRRVWCPGLVPSWRSRPGDPSLSILTSCARVLNLTDITKRIAERSRCRPVILPMTERCSSRLAFWSATEWVEFQDYFVRRRHRDDGLRYSI